MTASGEPELHDAGALRQQYCKLIGGNFSQELFHPDEVMAQSFVLVINQPSLGLLDAISQRLA